MALRNPPSWLEGGEHPAENDRLLIDSLLSQSGFVTPGAMKVSQTATPSLQLSIAAGGVFVDGTVRGSQGTYHCYNDATFNVAVSPGGSVSRKDLVALVVNDADTLGDDNSSDVIVVKGTPSTAPVPPPLPKNAIGLAEITVAINATSIRTADIKDIRLKRATALGGKVPCLSTARPSSPPLGMEIFETDTGLSRIWTAASTWAVVSDTDLMSVMLNPPRSYAYAGAAVTMKTATWVVQPLNGTAYDTATMHSNTSNNTRITIKTSGTYHILGTMAWATNSAGNRYVAVRRNGGTLVQSNAGAPSGYPMYLQTTIDYKLAAGDYLELWGWQNCGANLATLTGSTVSFLTVRWVAPY